MRSLRVALYLFLVQSVAAQLIWDIWSTTWNRNTLFSNISPSSPLQFVQPGPIGDADIVINDKAVHQSVWGFGGSLTDSSALILSNMKSTDSGNYWKLLHYLFDPTDGANAAGLSYIRVALGASDFSAKVYSFDDTKGDVALNNFNFNVTPSYIFSVLKDITSINHILKVHVCPWSPPGWMKDSGTMKGGSLNTAYISSFANYLLKSLQGFKTHGITPYAISIQNEPQNSNPTYPTCLIPAPVEAQVGLALRSLMDNNGFASTKLIGYEHNWDNAGSYPITLMQQAGSAFAGVAFHCYAGQVGNQDIFHAAYPDKEIYFTECASTIGSDWWSDIKWYMSNLWIGAINHNAHAGLMWNIALDGNGNPKLPGTNSCGGGCRALVQVNSDGSYSLNQDFYSMAQVSKAIIPKDVKGPWGQRIGVSVGGSLNWALVVGAFVTGRVDPTGWLRYSIVVLNWYDNNNGVWSPTPVRTTIEFQGMQATYTFPVGVTTLWWYAPPTAGVAQDVFVDTNPAQEHMGL